MATVAGLGPRDASAGKAVREGVRAPHGSPREGDGTEP